MISGGASREAGDVVHDDRACPATARLRLLGGWRLDSEPTITPPLGDNSQRLITLLALRGPLSRMQIAGAMWPEISELSASSRLRTMLWRLGGSRRLFDEAAGTLRLAPWIRVDVDEMRLRALDLDVELATGDAHREERPADLTVFEADLLPGWYDDWLVVDRERFRQLRLHALEAMATLAVRSGHFAAALDAGLAAVRADPLRESAHRCVICVHLAEGNTAEALRQYEACRTVLAAELNIEPSPSLLALLPAQATSAAPIPAGRISTRSG